MRISHRGVLSLAAPLVLALSAPALADATIDSDMAVSIKKGTKFIVEADVSMATSGTVTLTGTVAGTPFEQTKKFKTKKQKSKTIKFTVDPKKLGVVEQDDTIVLLAGMTASETGQAEPAVAQGGGSLPPPMMIIPGLGNELDSAAFKFVYEPFRDALNDNAGGVWNAKGKRATIRVTKYFSTSFPIDVLGLDIAKQGDKMLKKSKLFAKLDVVAQSTGGLVIRQAMAPTVTKKAPASLTGDVRQVYFMGAPQSGTPVAFLAQQALLATKDLPNGEREAELDAIKQRLVDGIDSPSAISLADLLLQPARKSGQTPPFLGVVELFLPSYAFALIPTSPTTTAWVDLPTLTGLSGTPQVAILSGLNAVNPDAGTTYHALYYSDVAEATGPVRTVDGLDMVAFSLDGATDLTLIETVNGAGDGVASETSTLMTAHPAWNAVLNAVDLGPGLHSVDAERPALPAYYNDPNVIGYILPRVLAPTPSDG